MILQLFIVTTFWLSYLAISFAAVITIADFAQGIAQRRKKPVAAEMGQDNVKLHISEGLIQVNRLPEEQEKP